MFNLKLHATLLSFNVNYVVKIFFFVSHQKLSNFCTELAELCREVYHVLLQVILLCTAAASWISIVYKSDHRTSTSDFDVLYDKPWIRISPYLIGLAGGVAIWALKTRSPINK